MLFVCDPSLANYAFQDNVPQAVISGLDMIALGFREGRHILAGPPATLNLLMKVQNLQPLTKIALKTARDRFSELMGLPGKFSSYVNLVPDNAGSIIRSVQGGKTIIEIPISHFAHSARIQNSVLLTEHLVDASIAKLMARFYQIDKNLAYIPLRTEPRCGGGSNLGVIVTQVANEMDRFCVVIVDSDKKSPKGPIGNTLKCVQKAFKKFGPSPLIELCVLDCKEMENALPDYFYEVAYGDHADHKDGPVFLKRLTELGAEEMRDFVDIKEGISLKQILSLDCRSQDFLFWHSNLKLLSTSSPLTPTHEAACLAHESCCKPEKCYCWFLKPNKTDILETAANHLEQWRPNQWALLTGHRRDIWRKVGQVVFEWSSGWSFSAA